MLQVAKLDFWVKNNYNVIFKGAHGVGKTAVIKEAFERAGIKWKYYSAATMDPWVDFIGVPKEAIDPTTGVKYLDLIRPKDFSNDEVEAIFFDEFNRSPKKIRNAVMELLQFKSINGKPFKNLRIIWAAINPDDDDETYDVEPIDPAQLDRFHVQVDVPYQADVTFFKNKYGERGATAVAWWTGLSSENKKLVTPRRLEYAVDMFQRGGDVRDILPNKVNVGDLVAQLSAGSYKKRLDALFTSKDKSKAIQELNNENFYNATIGEIIKDSAYITYFHDALPDEKLAALLANKKARRVLLGTVKQSEKLKHVTDNMIAAGGVTTATKKEINTWISKNYANTPRAIQLDLNTAINSLFTTGKVKNLHDKIEMTTQINTMVDKWYGVADVTDNICRFVCEVLIRTQLSAIKYKNMEEPLSRIIHFIGLDAFKKYASKQAKHYQSKFGGKAAKIDECISKFVVFNPLSMQDQVLRNSLTNSLVPLAQTNPASEITLPVAQPTSQPKRRGRPPKQKNLVPAITSPIIADEEDSSAQWFDDDYELDEFK